MCECPGEADTSRGLTYTNGGDLVQMEQWYKSPGGLLIPTIEIPLTRGYVTRIYAADQAFTDGHRWHADVEPSRRTVYASTKIDGRDTFLHSLLAPEWGLVDHADGDGLNNQRHNLRDGSGFRNNANKGLPRNNKSGYKGVRWNAKPGTWRADIGADWKQIYLGTFGTAKEAADAYDRAAVHYFGEYAVTNAMLSQVTDAGTDVWQHNPPVKQTHCRRAGHEYTPENTFINSKGRRECKKCIKISNGAKSAKRSLERARRREQAA